MKMRDERGMDQVGAGKTEIQDGLFKLCCCHCFVTVVLSQPVWSLSLSFCDLCLSVLTLNEIV